MLSETVSSIWPILVLSLLLAGISGVCIWAMVRVQGGGGVPVLAHNRERLKMFIERKKGLGAIRAKIGPTSDVDKIFSKMYSQYVLFRNKYS